MSMGGSIAPAGTFRAQGIRYRRRIRSDGRLPMAIALFLALWLAFISTYALTNRFTPKTADLPAVSSEPLSIAPPAAALVPVPAPALPLGDTVSQPRTAAPHVVKARAAAIRVTPAAPTPHVVTAPKPAPAPSSPTPASSCGTVASVTEPVASLLPGPLGGSGGVVQTVACVLP